jgi:hypothetical protein
VNLQTKEPWYVVTSNSHPAKILTHWIALLILAAGLGSCLVSWKTDPVGFITGLFSMSLLLFFTYQKGMNDGAASMYIYMTTRARDAMNAIGVMEEILRRKNDKCDD